MVVGDFAIETETLVVGAGPGGYVAAIRAAQLGQKVTIVEKGNLGGVCLNVGCIPSKALISASHRYEQAKHSEEMGIKAENVTIDFAKVQEWKASVVKKLTGGVEGLLKGNKVEIVKGEAYFVDANTVRVVNGDSAQTYTFKNAIIATGSRPIELPNFKFSNRILDSTGALNLGEVPKSLVVIGGGYIGIELGTAYANFGTKVTILEGAGEILSGFEKQMAAIIKKRLKKKGVEVVTNALAKGAEEREDGVTVTYEANGETKTIDADYVLVTVGRRPNTDELGLEQIGIKMTNRGLIEVDQQCRTSVPNIFAIGDIVPGPALAHKASYEGKVAAEAIAGHPSAVDYVAIPAVVFSDPECASVGYFEQQAKDEGIDVIAAKFPFAANGRALALNDTDGFLKLVVRKEDGVIIGAQIIGPNASDMIAELGLAIEAGMTAEDIALTIHAHPTLGEIAMEAAEVALGTPIHIITK
ncbi:dihydrolipoyl dehydrogenase [Geobacillus stearothermophilus]|uniref:Dihydrolipoyl dehydrogenase n=2 Tax=Geobacillus stearothermophilus TaxID=1422 RepID=DLDH1_GEOSE|nr:dihydrolipoyl dehydrogenase [Geobacillus stearothermophilus]P11959.2 RecName: Full=Dihydrolipoyl dehydrogenase; AltName: Full=Dihydrolipoamide dehydrogenase; AltName: Full=E3 component of pyruvate complex [Geobacillus stearothermophilus]MED4333155.1 dihydrolipoyl dehydrogenase [Geobacillus stearothermophilus]MED4832066.1 dihydrolipoyl dehydrogenase [Geobacillus stearothermophilus]MED4996179.1 dihydrolipoyl dehydrogenase [Geobacillus stearothermophilus]CAA37631.1 dihydrolipoamide dehydrogena